MRLIDADALREYIKECDYCRNCDERDRFCQMDCELPELTEKVERMIAEQPTVDPVKHGHWIKDNVNGQKCMWCSNCKNIVYPCSTCGYGRNIITYCPWCGAKQDEVSE